MATTPELQAKRSAAIAQLREAIEQFVFAALKAENGDPVAIKKMLELSVEVQPAMEKVVEAVTNTGVK